MEKFDYLKLKSGTDVRGVAVATEHAEINLTDEVICTIARAFVTWLTKKTGKTNLKIAVGHDSRISGQRILKQVVNGVTQSGADLVYTGLSSTPSMFMLLKKSNFGCDASIMITASHMPFDRNGLKFFTTESGLDGKDVAEILTIANEGNFVGGNGGYYERSYMDEYSADLVQMVRTACGCDQPLKGRKIVVDAGNGAGGFYAESVLAPLGADISCSQFLEPDGMFPNHIPNPEDKDAMASISSAVLKHGADLGIIFDTDVDRAGAVDEKGVEINRDRLIALISAILLREQPGTIVTDSVTSDGLAEFITKHGGKHLRFKRGYRNVIDKSVELNNAGIYSPLAIETSGHAALKENYFLDDGAYLITRILILFAEQMQKGEKLCDLIADMPMPKEEGEVRLSFTAQSVDFKKEGAKVIDDLMTLAGNTEGIVLAPDNYEGVRMSFVAEEGWCLVRMSVHDPIMPINFASDKEGGCKQIATKLLGFLKEYSFLNIEKLEKYINC